MKFSVEIGIGLSGSMHLSVAHDIEKLQEKIGKLNNVERGYVHLDFEFTGMQTAEHRMI